MKKLVACLFCVGLVLMGCPFGEAGDPELVGTWQGTTSIGGQLYTIGLTKTFASNGDYSVSMNVEGQIILGTGTYDAFPGTGRLTTRVTHTEPSVPELHGTYISNYSITGDSLRIWRENSDQQYIRVFKSMSAEGEVPAVAGEGLSADAAQLLGALL